MSCDLKLTDLLELSKVYAPEYNMPELHDRVLVFDVMADGWETDAILASTEQSDDSENADESAGGITSNGQLKEVKNEGNAEGEFGAAAESDIETGSTSRQDSGLNNESHSKAGNVIASDENHLSGGSTTSAQNLENSEKGILRQHKIFVHSSWLAVQSKYFRSLFYSGIMIYC